MIVDIRAKKIRVPESITEYIRGKLRKSEKYFPTINRIEVFLSKQKYLYIVEIVVNIVGNTLKIKQQSADLRSAVDMSVDKIEQQLRKEKERVKSRKKSFRACLLEDKYEQAEKMSMDMNKRRLVPAVSSIDEAVEIMNDKDYMFWIFTDKETGKLSVIYEKSESNYGLFEIEKRR